MINRTDESFSRLRRTLPIALLQAREVVMTRFRPMLKEFDISEQQWRVMRAAQEAPLMETAALAEAACILPSSLSRMLKALVERDFIVLVPHPGDRRRQRIALTKPGEAFLKEVAPESARVYRGIESKLGAEALHDLLDRIDVLINALDEPDEARRGKPPNR